MPARENGAKSVNPCEFPQPAAEHTPNDEFIGGLILPGSQHGNLWDLAKHS